MHTYVSLQILARAYLHTHPHNKHFWLGCYIALLQGHDTIIVHVSGIRGAHGLNKWYKWCPLELSTMVALLTWLHMVTYLGKNTKNRITLVSCGEETEVTWNRRAKETFDNTAFVSSQSGTTYLCREILLPPGNK